MASLLSPSDLELVSGQVSTLTVDESAYLSDAEAVREFTMEAGQPTPEKPIPMSLEETTFIAKMILDETMELMATVLPPAEAKAALKGMIDKSEDLPQETYAEATAEERAVHQCADQADALVDIYYYSLNAAAKKGMNLSSVFKLVHGANMAKRDPATGHFIKRESDGKIIKPAGWKPPDVEAELKRQLAEGSWAAK